MVKLFVPILLIGLCLCSDLYLFMRYINPALLPLNPKLSALLKVAW